MENDIVLMLRKKAEELAARGFTGWSSTMLEAADVIEELKAAQQTQSDKCPHCQHGLIVLPDKNIIDCMACAGTGKRLK